MENGNEKEREKEREVEKLYLMGEKRDSLMEPFLTQKNNLCIL